MLLSLLTPTGCGTIGVRIYDEFPEYPYPAVKSELECMGELFKWDYGCVMALPVIIDFPFTVVGDTILFPYDYFFHNKKQ